jgi:phospholipid N-methyltransferase
MNRDELVTRPQSGFWHFLWAGLANRGQTGAIVPSGKYLVRKMIAPIPRDYSGQIIELGAGSGPLTIQLAAKCPRARILACEVNPTLARICRDNLVMAGLESRVEIALDFAERLLSRFSAKGAVRPDFILSGIPLGNLSRKETHALVHRISRALAPGGMYIQFQYSLIDRNTIRRSFPRLRVVPAFLNVPPAFVYYGQK